jgi:hypothetical protein
MPSQAWNLSMEIIFQISGHPKVGEKAITGPVALRFSQKTGFSGKAFKQALHERGGIIEPLPCMDLLNFFITLI